MPSSTGAARTGAARTQAKVTLPALRVAAVLTVVVLAWQFVTAGQLFPGPGPVELHAAGAIALHVVSGAAAIAAGLHQRRTGGPFWPFVLAAVVFVLSFVQAYDGQRSSLWIHVPGAMVLTVGAVWVMAWSLRRSA